MFKNYIAYIKDNPEEYWFKRKLYGWGWTPATREGWFVVGVYVLFVINFVSNVETMVTSKQEPILVVAPVLIATLILIIVCYLKGEPPKWQWGKSVESRKS